MVKSNGVHLPGDFVTEFVNATSGSNSPVTFRKWTGISVLAAACERRVWLPVGARQTFPNLYIFLVAGPGTGKQIIDDGKALIEGMNECPFWVSPDNMTKASMVDQLAKAKSKFVTPTGKRLDYRSMYIVAEEAQVFMPAYDGETLGLLNKIYNNPPLHKETRRHGPAQDVVIPQPQLNLLMGVQPGWMVGTFPEIAWTTGLMSRTIMVYVEEPEWRDIFAFSPDNAKEINGLRTKLRTVGDLYGPLDISQACQQSIVEWDRPGGPPTPEHSKLHWYCKRRTLHSIKLAIVSAISRGAGTASGQSLELSLFDIERGRQWLLEAEAEMPGIFRAMIGKTDQAVLEELSAFATAAWKLNGQKPIAEASLWGFLGKYMPADKVEKLLLLAERSNVVARVAGTNTWLPRPRHLHGVE